MVAVERWLPIGLSDFKTKTNMYYNNMVFWHPVETDN